MVVASVEIERTDRINTEIYVPNPGFEHFVAKIQKVITRKGKDYFVSRVTIPKEVINNIEADGEEYLFFKVKKAEWFHMLNWDNMEQTWAMLPADIKNKAILDGVVDYQNQIPFEEILRGSLTEKSATNTMGIVPLAPQGLGELCRETR